MKEIKSFKFYTDKIDQIVATIAPPPYRHTRMYEHGGRYFIIVKDEGPDFSDPAVYTLWEVSVPPDIDIKHFVINDDVVMEQLVVNNGLSFSLGKTWDNAVKEARKALLKLYSEKQ